MKELLDRIAGIFGTTWDELGAAECAEIMRRFRARLTVSRRCVDCWYSGFTSGQGPSSVGEGISCVCCDYILLTGKRRPCPAGDGCTVRREGRRIARGRRHWYEQLKQ